MMKLYLVFNVEYDEDVERNVAEFWAAESRENLWDLKYPNRAGDWVPSCIPTRNPNEPLKVHERRCRKWARKKDQTIKEYLGEKKREIESYTEIPFAPIEGIDFGPGLIASYAVETGRQMFARYDKESNNSNTKEND